MTGVVPKFRDNSVSTALFTIIPEERGLATCMKLRINMGMKNYKGTQGTFQVKG